MAGWLGLDGQVKLGIRRGVLHDGLGTVAKW